MARDTSQRGEQWERPAGKSSRQALGCGVCVITVKPLSVCAFWLSSDFAHEFSGPSPTAQRNRCSGLLCYSHFTGEEVGPQEVCQS